MQNENKIVLSLDSHEARLLDTAIDRMRDWTRRNSSEWQELQALSARLEQARRDFYDRSNGR